MSNELLSHLAVMAAGGAAKDYSAVVASVSPLEVLFRGVQLPAVDGLPDHPHAVGDQIRILRSEKQIVVSATGAHLPSIAVVTESTADDSNITVTDANGRVYQVQVVGGVTPLIGTSVVLMWNASGGFCLGKRGVAASPPSPPAPPPAALPVRVDTNDTGPDDQPPRTHRTTATLYAQQTGTGRDGAWRKDGDARWWLVQGSYQGGGSNSTGFWFYGSQVKKVAGAEVSEVQVWLRRMPGFGGDSPRTLHLVRHTATVKPTTPPAVGASVADATLKVGESGWYTLPTSWGQALADGTTKGLGIAYQGTADHAALVGIDHPSPTQRNSQSGALRITYTRST